MNSPLIHSSRNSSPSRSRRRSAQRGIWRAVILTLVFAAAVALLVAAQESSLWRSSYTSGGLLIGCLLFLTSYNVRKKLPFLPFLGTSRWWMQVHIHVAFFSVAIFLLHAGPKIPTGFFEQSLALLYVVVTGSGVYGLYITRTIPRRLTATGREVVFEQIPQRRAQLAARARQLILRSAERTDVLARFYIRRLVEFVERPRSLAYHVAPSLRQSKELVHEIGLLDRYLTSQQRQTGRELAQLVREKEDLDYHWALQGRLKVWLFLHIGLTYGLLGMSVLHGIVALAFGGGLR